jgi:hypothetical protein
MTVLLLLLLLPPACRLHDEPADAGVSVGIMLQPRHVMLDCTAAVAAAATCSQTS